MSSLYSIEKKHKCVLKILKVLFRARGRAQNFDFQAKVRVLHKIAKSSSFARNRKKFKFCTKSQKVEFCTKAQKVHFSHKSSEQVSFRIKTAKKFE